MRRTGARLIVSLILVGTFHEGIVPLRAQESQPSPAQAAATRSVGTVKAISGKSITLTTDAGSAISVSLQDGARLLRVEPGEKDLKNAVPLELSDVEPGDRVLARGKMSEDGKSLLAASLTFVV